MKKLQNLSDVNTNTQEGRYLMAALAKLTTESQTDKTPDEVMDQCYILSEEMFKNSIEIENDQDQPVFFTKELEILINKFSMENGSNTPDFILSNFLSSCLLNFNETLKEREQWYGRKIS
jgi:hypothetical protein